MIKGNLPTLIHHQGYWFTNEMVLCGWLSRGGRGGRCKVPMMCSKRHVPDIERWSRAVAPTSSPGRPVLAYLASGLIARVSQEGSAATELMSSSSPQKRSRTPSLSSRVPAPPTTPDILPVPSLDARLSRGGWGGRCTRASMRPWTRTSPPRNDVGATALAPLL